MIDNSVISSCVSVYSRPESHCLIWFTKIGRNREVEERPETSTVLRSGNTGVSSFDFFHIY